MSRTILALDQGTTSSRAILFDERGHVVARAQREFRQIFPRPGWVEHDPEEIWTSQIEVAREVVAHAGVDPAGIAGIGITNQRETVVIWERASGRPIANAIVWQDRRTAEHCGRLRAQGFEGTIRAKTGLVIDPYFSGTKLTWMLEHIPGCRERAEAGDLAWGTIDSWLVWKLTEGALHATDASNASRTLLFDVHTGQWDDQLLEIFGVPRALLPEVRASSGFYAETSALGLSKPVPIAGIAGDQQAALFGQTCFRAGMAKNTYGTGCFMLLHTGNRPIPSTNLLTTVAWQVGDRREFALEGSVFIAGAAVQWLRDGLGLIRDASEIEALARSVDDSGDVAFVPALSGLGTPHWDPYARGTIVGLSRGTTAAHLARATLEAIAHQSADVMEAMNADSRIDLAELRVDGGAAANDLLLQIQADLLGVPVVRPRETETTALGAAYLAGLATGVWRDTAEIARHWERDRVFEPAIDADRRSRLRRLWARAVERSRGWVES